MPDIYMNGRFCPEEEAKISVLDGAVQVGDGIFETIRGHRGVPAFFAEHMKRMRSGAHLLRIPFGLPDDEIRRALVKLCSGNDAPEARIRLMLTRGAPGCKPAFIATAEPYTPHTPEKYDEGYVLAVSEMIHFSRGLLAGLKSLNYLAFTLARREANEAGADEALMLNEHGNVAECSSANIFCVRNGELLTPDLKSGILPGVVRDLIIRLASDAGISVHEKPLPLRELLEADEAFITSSLRGIMPVLKIDERVYAGDRPVTRRLSGLYAGELDRVCRGL